MYRRTNIPAKNTEFDAGIKPYLSDDDYETLHRAYTAAEAQSVNPYPESEIAPSYLDPSAAYEAVEYDWPHGLDVGPPYLPPDVWPEVPPVVGPGGVPGGHGWSVTFLCNISGCFCPGKTTCFDLRCSHGVSGINVKESPPGFTVKLKGGKICVTAPEGSPFKSAVRFDVLMNAFKRQADGSMRRVPGRHHDIYISQCPEWQCETCDCTGVLAWDTATSGKLINRPPTAPYSCVVAITDSNGDCGPYTWQVTGTGFTLAAEETEGLSNTLTADGTACGVAKITVTSCDGEKTAIGKVKCSTGNWTRCGSTSIAWVQFCCIYPQWVANCSVSADGLFRMCHTASTICWGTNWEGENCVNPGVTCGDEYVDLSRTAQHWQSPFNNVGGTSFGSTSAGTINFDRWTC